MIGTLIVDIVIISPQLGHILQVFPRQGDEFWLRRFGTEEEALQCAQNFSTISAIPDEFLIDIFLTDSGSELAQGALDRKFCEMAVVEATKSIAENDGEAHPYVGAVVVKEGKVLATGYRGETGEGRHAEFCALKKINDDVNNVDLTGCTVYTTLEPCSQRNSPNKTACATRLINAKVSRVVYGLADKDESVYGHVSLAEASIDVGLFPKDLIQTLVALNKKWSDTRRQPETAPPPTTPAQ